MRRHLALLLLGLLFVGLIAALVIIRQNQGSHAANLPKPALRTLAAGYGVALGDDAPLSMIRQPLYADILTSEFTTAVITNELQWNVIHPSATGFDFASADEVVKFAQAYGMPIQGNYLVWGNEKQLPGWLKNGNYDRSTLLQLIANHVSAVATQYKNQVRVWSVVNEAFSREQHVDGTGDWWLDHIGDQSYIDTAFRAARAADPNAKLILDDSHNAIDGSVSDAMYDYLVDAKARGVPIDGVGMQLHIDAVSPPDKQALVKNIGRFGALGVSVYITALDVQIGNLQGTREQQRQVQRAVYKQVAQACVESQVCRGINIAGITDEVSWWDGRGAGNSEALLFDANYDPKPAYWGLREVFKPSTAVTQ